MRSKKRQGKNQQCLSHHGNRSRFKRFDRLGAQATRSRDPDGRPRRRGLRYFGHDRFRVAPRRPSRRSAAKPARGLCRGLLLRIPVFSFGLVTARVHARLSSELAAKKIPVGPHDLIIAATAMANGYAVAARDERSFPKIPGLTVLRW